MADYEQSDATHGPLVMFGGGVLILVLVSMLAMGWLHKAWRHTAGPLTKPTPLLVRPVVEADPAELHQYQWLDRSQGLVQIPIEEAMRVVSQGGSRATDATAIPDVDRALGRSRSSNSIRERRSPSLASATRTVTRRLWPS